MAKYAVGDVVYSIVYSTPYSELEQENLDWMMFEHPKYTFETPQYRSMWPYQQQYPKLNSLDFEVIVRLLSGEFEVARFQIVSVSRSNNTGEFNYKNDDDDTIPESNLFETEEVAYRELNRIYNMFKIWSARQHWKSNGK